MNSLTVRSPAKVNLFLKVLSKRRDGYHEIVTLFHRISLGDSLVLRKIPEGIRIRTNDPSLPVDSGNLIWRAYRLLREKIPSVGGVSVDLRKRIPVGAGLGGGSSDAASFLIGMNALYRLKIPAAGLYAMGSTLGADVNFFLKGVNQAIGAGRGEIVYPLPASKPLWFVVVALSKSLSTKQVYAALRFTSRESSACDSLTKKSRVVRLLRPFRTGDAGRVAPLLRNDLQKTSVRLYPMIGKALRFFDEWGVSARLMSGSGPTVFALCKNRRLAGKLAQTVRTHFRFHKKIFIARTA